ncbi:MAG TPA: FtsX-like permease family protein, partial [Thermoanaerobaculia bacterium]|nr:FtsX-like permease family protein [Thermoanaerobaculia bacterium]
IRNVPFKVVGVLVPKGASASGSDQDDSIIVPYTTAIRHFIGRQAGLRRIYVQAASLEALPAVEKKVGDLLRQRHRIEAGGDEDFKVKSQLEIAEYATQTSRTMTLLLSLIASVSLVVGGIGIMNIMLVSVTERTREIGIRLAIGARGSDVLTQFLVESIVMGVLGGLIGLAVGIIGSKTLAYFTGWETVISPVVMLVAVVFSGAVGVFFGYYPARKAAALHPIQALRYE